MPPGKLKRLAVYALDKSRWNDFEKLLGERGACGGCWCMTWRLKSSDFEKMKGEVNKKAMFNLTKKGEPTGVIGYLDNTPVAWCALAPREKFLRLENSKVLKRVDEQPVWSLTCFFIDKKFKRQGLSLEMIKAVITYCKKQKIKIIESYPTEPNTKLPDAFVWTGIASVFEKAGFEVAARHLGTRPVMRYYL